MSFPNAEVMIPPAEANSNIKFSDLQLSYINNEGGGGSGDLDSVENPIGLSLFRGANFTSGDTIPGGSAAISIGSHFCGKTFGPGEGEKEGEPEPGGPEEELPP